MKRKPEGNGSGGTRRIGIAGCGRSVGVTHLAILTASYLEGIRRESAALVEGNESGAFAKLYFFSDGKHVTKRTSHSFNRSGITYYEMAGGHPLSVCPDGVYDSTVIDFGHWREEIRTDFLACDRRFLVGSLTEWQLPELAEIQEALQGRNCEYFAVFGETERIRDAERFLGIRIEAVPFIRNPFAVTEESLAFFRKILK